jgi:hypothetical protein
MSERKKLGDLLVETGRLTREQVDGALELQEATGGRLGTILVVEGLVSEDMLAKFLSYQLDVPSVNLIDVDISPEVTGAVPLDLQTRHLAVPIAMPEDGGRKTLVLAMADPTDFSALDEIGFVSGCRVQAVVATEGSIRRHLGLESLASLKKEATGDIPVPTPAPASEPVPAPVPQAPPASVPTAAPGGATPEGFGSSPLGNEGGMMKGRIGEEILDLPGTAGEGLPAAGQEPAAAAVPATADGSDTTGVGGPPPLVEPPQIAAPPIPEPAPMAEPSLPEPPLPEPPLPEPSLPEPPPMAATPPPPVSESSAPTAPEPGVTPQDVLSAAMTNSGTPPPGSIPPPPGMDLPPPPPPSDLPPPPAADLPPPPGPVAAPGGEDEADVSEVEPAVARASDVPPPVAPMVPPSDDSTEPDFEVPAAAAPQAPVAETPVADAAPVPIPPMTGPPPPEEDEEHPDNVETRAMPAADLAEDAARDLAPPSPEAVVPPPPEPEAPPPVSEELTPAPVMGTPLPDDSAPKAVPEINLGPPLASETGPEPLAMGDAGPDGMPRTLEPEPLSLDPGDVPMVSGSATQAMLNPEDAEHTVPGEPTHAESSTSDLAHDVHDHAVEEDTIAPGDVDFSVPPDLLTDHGQGRGDQPGLTPVERQVLKKMTLLSAVADLLIEKGVVTKDEIREFLRRGSTEGE